jgi:hypothetical protein
VFDCDGNVDAGCGCGEAGPSGCDNTCGSTAANDDCGVCGGDNSSCTDDCGVVNGDNSSCADCAGVPNGDSELDDCGDCDGPGENIVCWDGSQVCDVLDCPDAPAGTWICGKDGSEWDIGDGIGAAGSGCFATGECCYESAVIDGVRWITENNAPSVSNTV